MNLILLLVNKLLLARIGLLYEVHELVVLIGILLDHIEILHYRYLSVEVLLSLQLAINC